jgi:hypothetical protein
MAISQRPGAQLALRAGSLYPPRIIGYFQKQFRVDLRQAALRL